MLINPYLKEMPTKERGNFVIIIRKQYNILVLSEESGCDLYDDFVASSFCPKIHKELTFAGFQTSIILRYGHAHQLTLLFIFHCFRTKIVWKHIVD